jgi:glycosyltransferase involved in cell wall biosynthesis
MRRLPFVITIHGGVLDLPLALKESFARGPQVGWEWGKVFGAILRSRKLLADADAILTCNTREAELLQKKYPHQRIQVQPHGVDTAKFAVDCRAAARQAWPAICGKQVLLDVARIHSVKNQAWLVEQLPEILRRNPDAILVLAGACTDQPYGDALLNRIRELGLEQKVILTGGLAPDDPRLLGLYQSAAVVILSSLSETFGLVLLEGRARDGPIS